MRKLNKSKILSLVLIIMMVFTFIPISLAWADDVLNDIEEQEYKDEHNDEDKEENQINELSSISIKPQINLQYGGIVPENPMVGQEFEVTYHINPEPFQHNISKPKEIVLVLDGSGSMDTIIKCEHGKTSSHYVSGVLCKPKTRLEELKDAAKAFINKMKSVENLKIGIVVYSSSATINPISRSGTTTVKRYYNGVWTNRSVPKYQSYTDEYFLDVNDSRLLKMIDNIDALGGTNTGEGLRKAKFLLDEGTKDANKTIVFMSDGLPTYYSITGTNLNHYKEIDNTTPSISGAGNEDSQDNINKSSAYAEAIGSEKIRGNGYNIFSIGYGLNSTGNEKMEEIHKSMGGVATNNDDPNNTFFATSEGAIESVFNKIADTLINSYSINDVKLNLNLSDSISAFNGGSVNINGHQVEIDPIVYERKENNWYRAEPQSIKFTVKAKDSGSIKLFKENSSLTYTDIEGKIHSVAIPNIEINVREYSATDADKLGVTFSPTKNGYLIGDNADIKVTFSHLGNKNISYTDAKFTLDKNSKPNNFITQSSFDYVLNFGNITESKNMTYNFNINDDIDINSEDGVRYQLIGSYEYNINGTKESNSNITTNVNVKRGQIRIKVNDSINNDITSESKVVLKDKFNNEIIGNYDNGYIIFDTVSTGSHEVVLKEVPEGCYIADENKNALIEVKYEKPVGTYTFTTEGAIATKELEIDAKLIGTNPNYPYLDEEITVTYEINPKEFIKDSTNEIIIKEAKLLFNLGDKFTPVDGEGLVSSDNGKYVLDFADKVKYIYDNTNNKYVADKFTVSFKIRANSSGENISFNEGKIEYENILDINNTMISNIIDTPVVTVRSISELPIYTGADIRILEIEPSDSFKLTNLSSRSTTGIEEIEKIIDDKKYKIEITHMTMAEFIGKVDDLNGKYDVIVIGKYVDNSLVNPNGIINAENNLEGTIWFKDYKDLENDITNKKAKEIKEFINSGQLVFIDSDIKEMSSSKLWWHTTNSQGDFNQSVDNLVKDMSVNSNSNDKKISIDNIVNKYIQRIKENNSLIRPKIVSTSPIGDSHDDDLGKIYKRNMRFDINVSDIIGESLTINLYLDINGDGLFKEEEIVKTIEGVNIPEDGYKLEYNLYNDFPQFIGYLEWRIEVVKDIDFNSSQPIKSYTDGNILFRRVTQEKRVINVLQISPFESGNLEASSAQWKGGNLNLKTNTAFQSLLKEKEVQDYEINIEVISYQDFYQGNNLGPGTSPLNGSKYHMIIMGFADTFREKSISNQGIEEIKKFIESGQGLMLTHDTLWYKSWDGWQKNIRNAPQFIRTFRDIIGQSRYIDPNNEDETGLNGEKITHDPNRPEVNGDDSKYPKEAGATLLELNGVNNSNSTEVYRVNESLITNYPFKLGETIRVRRTHGQYLQLNFEDDDVVPLFNLTENNNNNVGNNEYIEWNHQSNKVNRYDSRNSYYTYSKGNITFSGTGENSRESIEYPESELRLFVNTIVKAERGANHKPEVYGLESVTEIPYNSDLEFNAIVKDVDGDRVKINKISLNGVDISSQVYKDPLNKIPSGFKNQGSQFPITIPSSLFIVNKQISLTIEAEDSRGAITTKEYKITPVQNPLLTSKGQTINTLVGENITFEIQLDKENDTNPSSILVDSIEVTDKNEIVTLSNINTEYRGGKIYLVGNLKALIEVTGEELPIIINYSNGTSSMKRCEAKIILNSRSANVNVILKVNDYSNQNLGISPKVTLINKISNKVYENNISIIDGQTNFNSIEAGEYELSISEIIGYDILSILVNGTNVSFAENNKIKFNISFSENSKIIEIAVEPQVSEVIHGLYQGIGDNRQVNIIENLNGFEMTAGMNVNFASTFVLGGNSIPINLSIDSKLEVTNAKESINKNNIKIYKVTSNDEKTILDEVSESKLDISVSNSQYVIKINESIQRDTRILITYSAIVPESSNEEEFTNTISISNKNKSIKVYTIDTGENNPAYLPELF